MSPLSRLDAYATDDPDFNEGHPEDRCPFCERAVDEHPCWQHRVKAFVALIAGRVFGFLKDTSE